MQRKGRVGRVSPGVCYNIFSKAEYEKFIQFTEAPVYTDNIGGTLLDFLAKDPPLVSHIDIPFTYKNKTNNNKLEMLNFSTFLSKFIEPPLEDAVNIYIKKLFVLGALEYKGDNKLVITDLGRAMAAFGLTKPEYAKALICSYNYKCRREMCEFIAFITEQNFKGIDKSLFNQPKKHKDLNKDKEIQKKYSSVLKKWSSKYGDANSFMHIYNEYLEQKKKQAENQQGGFIGWMSKLIGGSNEENNGVSWINKNFLNKKSIKEIKNNAKQLNRRFGRVHGIVKNSGAETYDYIFRNNPPNIPDTLDERFMMALANGLITNLMINHNNKYISCYYEDKILAGIDRGSLYALNKKLSKYVVFCIFDAKGGRKFLNVVNAVTPKVLTELKTNKMYDNIIKCKQQKIISLPKKQQKGKRKKKKKFKKKKYTKKW